MSRKLLTNVSQAYWYSPDNKDTPFEPAIFPKEHGAAAWLDRLFEGGICIPEGGKPLVHRS